MHHEIRPQKASSSDPPTTGSSGDPRVTDQEIASHRASREPAILIRRPCHHCTFTASASALHERTRPCHTTQDETPQFQDRSQSRTAPPAIQGTNPGNTAGPVLPHRPSETPPVLRNHREGLVTCSTVATCTEKTTPVGSLVTQRKHRRFPRAHSGCSRRSAALGITRSPAWAAASSPVSPVLYVTPAGSASPGSIGLPRRAGVRLHAINDAEARWWHWQVTERCGGLVRQYRDVRFDVLLHDPAIRRAGLGAELAEPGPRAA